MAYMRQNLLNQTCYTINQYGENYLTKIQYEIKNIADWFNTYWISNTSRQVANEIQLIIDTYGKNVSQAIKNLNSNIRRQVYINNSKEDATKVYYRGFSVSTPLTNQLDNLNSTLPDGKVGSLPYLTDMSFPINHAKLLIEDATNILKNALVKSSALYGSEKTNIQQYIILAEKNANNSLNELAEFINNRYN